MPRLHRFAQAYPDISLNLSAAHTPSDFTLGQADIDIRYGIPQWGDLVVEPLFEEAIVPLASPAFIKAHKLKRVDQLLERAADPEQCERRAVVGLVRPLHKLRAPDRFSLRFDRAQMSLDAATQGLGVALESAMNAGGLLANGKLKAPFGMDQAIRVKAHFAVYPERHAKRPAVEAFLSWLHGEAART
jgi:DNA-binding transcriptional LysR family regulator